MDKPIKNILIVGGTWSATPNDDGSYGRKSKVVEKIAHGILYSPELFIENPSIKILNGGNYNDLENILTSDDEYDIVFWWANVEDNNLPKIRNVKDYRPHTMLVTSKRNDDGKYSFQELVQKTLAAKANLTFEFVKKHEKVFNIRIFDPLGCVWYDGTNLKLAVNVAIKRLKYLRSITRQQTVKSNTNKSLVLSWYFDQFKQPEYQSDKIVEIPDEQKFVDIVKNYAHKFQEFMPVDCKTERFIGNASFKPMLPPQVGRCGKGMPSFRKDDYIFVSKRNIDKQFIELENFVPVYMEDDKLYYCGDEKPSVDTPVQIRLYQNLPNINYMLHSHCYVKGAPFTSKAIPCGAIEECDEVLDSIKQVYCTFERKFYAINMKGHGSLVMCNSLDYFDNIDYVTRTLPELM